MLLPMGVKVRRSGGYALVALGLALIGSAVLHYWTSPRLYESIARLAVKEKLPDIGSSLRRPEDYYLLHLERIESTSVLHPVITNLSLQKKWMNEFSNRDEPRVDEVYETLRRRITLSFSKESGLIDIKIASEDRIESAEIANEIARVYQDERLKTERELRTRGLRVLEEHLSKREQEIADAESLVKRLRKEAELPDGEEVDWSQPQFIGIKSDLDHLRRFREALGRRIAQEVKYLADLHLPLEIVDLAEPALYPVAPRFAVPLVLLALGLLLMVTGAVLLVNRRETPTMSP
jgi:uncharacterized protein involved in exopolysaccharide biosynthesis